MLLELNPAPTVPVQDCCCSELWRVCLSGTGGLLHCLHSLRLILDHPNRSLLLTETQACLRRHNVEAGGFGILRHGKTKSNKNRKEETTKRTCKHSLALCSVHIIYQPQSHMNSFLSNRKQNKSGLIKIGRLSGSSRQRNGEIPNDVFFV